MPLLDQASCRSLYYGPGCYWKGFPRARFLLTVRCDTESCSPSVQWMGSKVIKPLMLFSWLSLYGPPLDTGGDFLGHGIEFFLRYRRLAHRSGTAGGADN